MAAGFAVIVDATFLHRRSRDRFRLLARRLGKPFVIIDCKAPPQQLRERLALRERAAQDASEAGVRVMESQLQLDEPLGDAELTRAMAADSGEDQDALWSRLQLIARPSSATA
jgi:predicted kinase